jgi:hypothetical protein
MEPQKSAIQLRAKLEVQRLPAHALDNLPATMHGDWERQTIDGVLASETERTN